MHEKLFIVSIISELHLPRVLTCLNIFEYNPMLENHHAGANIYIINDTEKKNTQTTIYDDFLQSCAMSITLKHVQYTLYNSSYLVTTKILSISKLYLPSTLIH